MFGLIWMNGGIYKREYRAEDVDPYLALWRRMTGKRGRV